MSIVERVEGQVVEPGATLEELAATANQEHRAVVEAGRTALDHAICAGEALLAAKKCCEPGSWLRWLQSHFDAVQSVASAYMRIATHKDAVLAALGAASTQAEALVYLRGLPSADQYSTTKRLPTHLKAEAFKLRGQGLSTAQIASLLNLQPSTLGRWFDPEIARRDYARRKHRLAERRQLEEEARRRAARAAARRAGGAIAEAYSMAERMQDVLGRAEREAGDRESRAALKAAGEHYRHMRDQIVKVLGDA